MGCDRECADWHFGLPPRGLLGRLLAGKASGYYTDPPRSVSPPLAKLMCEQMKKFIRLPVFLSVVGLASVTNAQLVLKVDLDGTARIENVGSVPLTYDGYQIQDAQEPGRLIPENLRIVQNYLGGWNLR
jgi:hypothetical protein